MNMKKAVIYTRVSTEDQKENGFSLQDQESRLRRECIRKGYAVIAHYQDDHSAKTFNRPKFQLFLKDFKEKKIKPDIFMCVRMDRFTRNMAEGINMLTDFKKIGLEFELLEGQVDLDVPESLVPYMLSMLLPQVENERRGLNTKRGMRQAVKEGRWPWKAPIGYLNDPINTGLLIVDNNRAPLINFAFETYSTGVYSVEQIRLLLAERGLKTVKQNLINILRQSLYTGMIRLQAWKDEPEEMYKGLHEPIVTEEIFTACQNVFLGKLRKHSRLNKKNENLPLRGHLQCVICGGKLTGSNSKSRNGAMHSYYHCQKGCKERFRADVANDVFIQFLQGFEVGEEVQELYTKILMDVFKANDVDRKREKEAVEAQIDVFQRRLNTLDDNYYDGNIDSATYKEVKQRYEASKNELISKHIALQPEAAAMSNYLRFSVNCLKTLGTVYHRADFEGKQQIIGSIFPDNLIFAEKKYRTTRVNEAVQLICNMDKAYSNIKNKKAGILADLSTLAPPSGLEPETL